MRPSFSRQDGGPKGSHARVRITAATHRGATRRTNEDAAGAGGWIVPEGGRAVQVATTLPVACVVADGVGGHPAGDLASRLVVVALASAATSIRSLPEAQSAIAAAHAALHTRMRAEPVVFGMATTVALVHVGAEEVLVANVGDTRVYELAGAGLLRLSVRPPAGGRRRLD